jgi:hypothetical protein
MVEVEVGQKNIGYIVPMESDFFQGSIQRMAPPPIVVTEELIGLFVAETIVDQYQTFSILDQKTSGGYVDHIIHIGRIGLLPYRLGNHAEHGAAIQLKISGFYGVEGHSLKMSRKVKHCCKVSKGILLLLHIINILTLIRNTPFFLVVEINYIDFMYGDQAAGYFGKNTIKIFPYITQGFTSER